MKIVLFSTLSALLIAGCGQDGVMQAVAQTQETKTSAEPYMPGMIFMIKRNMLDSTSFVAVGSWPSQNYQDDTYKLKVGPVFPDEDFAEGTQIKLFREPSSVLMFKTEHGYSNSFHTGKLVAKPADIHLETYPM